MESVTVRDFSTSTEYRILCEKWLSGVFGDQETFGDFPITSSCMFIPGMVIVALFKLYNIFELIKL